MNARQQKAAKTLLKVATCPDWVVASFVSDAMGNGSVLVTRKYGPKGKPHMMDTHRIGVRGGMKLMARASVQSFSIEIGR